MDVSLNQLIQFYLTNTLNLRPLTPQVIPCYTHKHSETCGLILPKCWLQFQNNKFTVCHLLQFSAAHFRSLRAYSEVCKSCLIRQPANNARLMSLCFNSDADCSTQCWRWLTEINGTVRSLRGAVRNSAQFTASDRRRCDKTVEFRRIGQCEWSRRQSARIYTVLPPPKKKRPPFILLISVKNHSILMIFGKLKPEKIWHKSHKDLSRSPVGCSHYTLGNPKKIIFNSIIYTCF